MSPKARQPIVVLISTSIAIIVILLVFVAGSNGVFDVTPECTEFRGYQSDTIYDCRGSLVVKTVGEFPEDWLGRVDVYCRPYEAIPSPHDIEELMRLRPKERPEGVVGFFADEVKESTMIKVFDVLDDSYVVCEARFEKKSIAEDGYSELLFVACNEFDDVGICKVSQVEWKLSAVFDGSERFQTSRNRWIVVNAHEFSHLELRWVG